MAGDAPMMRRVACLPLPASYPLEFVVEAIANNAAFVSQSYAAHTSQERKSMSGLLWHCGRNVWLQLKVACASTEEVQAQVVPSLGAFRTVLFIAQGIGEGN